MRDTILVAVLSGLLLTGTLKNAAGAMAVVDRVVAVVNGEVITMSDLQREVSLRKSDAAANDRQVLEDMIDRKLQMAAAKREGMDVTDKELADAVADIMKRNSFDTKQFEAALAKDGLTLDQYKIELREQMTLSRMFNKHVRSGLAVDDAEVRAYYSKNVKTFTLPEEIRLRQIFLPVKKDAPAAQAAGVKEKAEEAYARAKKGEDFIRLVREYSQGATVGQDGDLGFTQRESLLPEMVEAVKSLKAGDISSPFLCAGGYHIVKLEEVRDVVKPYDKVKDEIMNTLYQQKVENTYRGWLQTLRSDATIENRL